MSWFCMSSWNVYLTGLRFVLSSWCLILKMHNLVFVQRYKVTLIDSSSFCVWFFSNMLLCKFQPPCISSFNFCLLSSVIITCSAWVSLPWIIIWNVAPTDSLSCHMAYLIHFSFSKNHSPVLPIVHCLKRDC